MIRTSRSRFSYEIYPGSKFETIRDFENRSIEPGDQLGSLKIAGAPAHIIIRWQFTAPATVIVNGHTISMARKASGTEIEFDHTGTTALTWR
jgi:hypothetical protein